jgi:hypothetical protein
MEVSRMSQLNVKLSEDSLTALRRYAAKRRTPVSWLIKDYVEYLLKGGSPVVPESDDELSSSDLAALAQDGGAFDWLADEPDLYTIADGEPV